MVSWHQNRSLTQCGQEWSNILHHKQGDHEWRASKSDVKGLLPALGQFRTHLTCLRTRGLQALCGAGFRTARGSCLLVTAQKPPPICLCLWRKLRLCSCPRSTWGKHTTLNLGCKRRTFQSQESADETSLNKTRQVYSRLLQILPPSKLQVHFCYFHFSCLETPVLMVFIWGICLCVPF